MGRIVRLSVVQMVGFETADRCLDRATELIGEAVRQDADVILLQELFTGRYPCQSEDHARFDEAQPIPGPATDAMAALAKHYGVVIVAPLFERRAPGVYHNTAAVLDADGSLAGIYRKMHIPDDPLFYEKFYFTPGDLGFRPVRTKFATLGVGVCWDQWFPEAARLFALAGAEILLYPTAIGWIDEEKAEYGDGQRDAWRTAMRAHAIANGLFVGAANRVGIEGRLEFWGSSFVAGPNGQILAEADVAGDRVVTAQCDLAAIDVVRTHWPFLRDRRIDAYGHLTRRWIDQPAAPSESG